jgi:thiamine kinase-like enzyme
MRGSLAMDVEAIVSRIWPGEEARIEVLGGGITNHNFRVDVADGSFVLRVSGVDTSLLGIDRAVEYEASLAAAAVGIGPEVVSFVEPEGYLVTRFIEGHIVPLEEMRDPEVIRRIARALRAVHRGPSLPARFNSFRVVEDYRTVAFAHGATVPANYVWARQVARRVERARGVFAERPCHNDLLNANFIDDGDRVRIVDWEYAGMGDVFFDLANFSVNNRLDADDRRLLLEAYFGEVRAADERALRLMVFMSDFREAMWGVVQSAISRLDFDFTAYATEHFERMEATAASPAFAQALDG